jgi:hypothetical protein
MNKWPERWASDNSGHVFADEGMRRASFVESMLRFCAAASRTCSNGFFGYTVAAGVGAVVFLNFITVYAPIVQASETTRFLTAPVVSGGQC